MSHISTAYDTDIAVIGGGPVGLTLALALSGAGLGVAVIDPTPPQAALAPAFDGRAYAIAYASFRMWRALGVADELEPFAQPIEQILVTDGRLAGARGRGGPSFLHLHFDNAELKADAEEGGEGAEPEPLGLMIENRRLRLALEDAARARSGIRLLQPLSVDALQRDGGGVTATLSDGSSLRAPLLIGADGRGSFTRNWCGIRTIGRSYPSTAIVATLRHEKPHDAVAHEYFLPAGPFAILPLTDNRVNIVWTEPHVVAQTIMAMSDEDFLAEARRRFGDFLGELTLEGPRFSYPLRMQLAERLINDRVALAGDAAHAIHPIAGQGLNLGLRDVAALAECIVESVSLGLDPGDVTGLERYQRWRRFDNISMALSMDFFDRLFSNDIAPIRAARTMGLALVDKIGPARRYFMRQAGGAAGDLPKLLRGENLAA